MHTTQQHDHHGYDQEQDFTGQRFGRHGGPGDHMGHMRAMKHAARFRMAFGGPGRGPGGPGFGPAGPGFGPRGPRGGHGPFGGHGGPGPFGGFGGFGGPGFGRGRKVGRGDVRTAALGLLAEQPLHGYQIIQEIAQRSGGTWRPSAGSIYPMLQQLADEGLVTVAEGEGRRVFRLTEAGQTFVTDHQADINAVWESVNERDDDGVRELRNLIGQVGIAVMQVAQAGNATQIAAARQVLSATRRQLYRILAEDESGSEETAAATANETDATQL